MTLAGFLIFLIMPSHLAAEGGTLLCTIDPQWVLYLEWRVIVNDVTLVVAVRASRPCTASTRATSFSAGLNVHI